MQYNNINDIGSPEDWLKRAKSNLAIARQQKTEEIYLEDLCFEPVTEDEFKEALL